jgi:hypothetical protein
MTPLHERNVRSDCNLRIIKLIIKIVQPIRILCHRVDKLTPALLPCFLWAGLLNRT